MNNERQGPTIADRVLLYLSKIPAEFFRTGDCAVQMLVS
jgi:hypothetical protein